MIYGSSFIIAHFEKNHNIRHLRLFIYFTTLKKILYNLALIKRPLIRLGLPPNILNNIKQRFKYSIDNCNLNLIMKNPQASNQTFISAQQTNRFTSVDRMMQQHSDPDPVCYMPPQRTENDECLYEFELFEQQNAGRQQTEREKLAGKKNIELTLALTAQNEDLTKKIKEVKDLLNSEELKANIFKRKYDENEKIIADLRAKKEKILQESMKIKTLNESAIPNKSVELNTTNNTNAWLNEFLNKSELQNLWSKQKDKQAKQSETKVKSYTIDLSNFMNSARQSNQKATEKIKMNDSKCFDERPKSKIANKIATSRPLSIKPSPRVQLTEKQKILNKNLSQLRSMKKTKYNPQL